MATDKKLILTVIRHAEAAPAKENGHEGDLDRPLTELGRHQAAERGHSLQFIFGRHAFSKIGASPAKRALETAASIAKLVGSIPVVEVDGFCFQAPETDASWAEFHAAFDRLGHAPLSAYLADEEASEAVNVLGFNLASSLAAFVDEAHDGAHVIVVTHGIMGPLMVLSFAKSAEMKEAVTSLAMAEAAGFTVTFNGAEIVKMMVHQSPEQKAA